MFLRVHHLRNTIVSSVFLYEFIDARHPSHLLHDIISRQQALYHHGRLFFSSFMLELLLLALLLIVMLL